MKTIRQLTRENHGLKKKLQWMTLSRKHWMKCATLQGRDIKRLMKEQEKQKYEVTMIRENPKLYEVAKEITLGAGFDYHHPILGITTRAPRLKAKGRAKQVKPKPKATKSVKRKVQSKWKQQPKTTNSKERG